MTAKGDSGNASGHDDFARFLGDFKTPLLDTAAAMEVGNKTFAMVHAMSAATFASITAIAQRQGHMIQATVEGFATHGQEMLSAGTLEEKATRQIEFARRSYEAAAAHAASLAELYAKAQTDALDAVQVRITSLSGEVKAAIAQSGRSSLHRSSEDQK